MKFYSGEEKDRLPTYFDRLSSIDMKLLADLHYGNLTIPNEISLEKLTTNILPCLQNSTIIFVDTTNLKDFFDKFHQEILINYILITGDSDLSAPLHLISSHYHLLDDIFQGKTRIIHWFAMNCDFGNESKWIKSNIFSCIPQGISQWNNQRYRMQLISKKTNIISQTQMKTNDYWIFTSFQIVGRFQYRKYRQPLWYLSCYGRLKSLSKCFYGTKSKDQLEYYKNLRQSKFVFSPPGVGMDCYRTWEILYLGSIPIVLNSTLNSIYEQLPILIVNNFEEIQEEFLKNIYKKMIKQTFDYRRLYKGYWQNRIHSYKNSSEFIQFHYTINK
ncbi:hypothetical protein I4U23_000246 [Adineta vaga]|nr:hypothetical protein I4U23_000246 [Adineta vaga]